MNTEALTTKLKLLQNKVVPQKALVGFDGYVDLIQKAVQFCDKEQKVHYRSLNDIGLHIAAAAGKSAQVELTTLQKKLGGNGPIMANSLASLGIHNYCAGTMGYPLLHEVFSEF